MTFLLKTGIFFLNVIFFFMKLLPVEKKIVYISRQSEDIPIDFYLLKQQMESKFPDYKNIVLVRTIGTGILNKIYYFFHMLCQMYHLATAQMVILDSYCITISVLKQRKSLLIVQMWHALGALKKFGYSILDKEEGSSSKIAKVMKMHRNYTYVFASGENCRVHFAEAFRQPLDKVKVYPLPRLDLLLNKEYQKEKKLQIKEKYPFLEADGKQIVVYAPTFRKDESDIKRGVERLFNVIDFQKYNLIYKPHPISHVNKIGEKVIYDTFFTTEDMLYIADYVVTDYSAIIFETLLLQKKLVLYAFDYEKYTNARDFYIDYKTLFARYIASTADDVISHLQQDESMGKYEYDSILLQMVSKPVVSYTEDICAFLMKEKKERCDLDSKHFYEISVNK